MYHSISEAWSWPLPLLPQLIFEMENKQIPFKVILMFANNILL